MVKSNGLTTEPHGISRKILLGSI